MTVLRTAGPAVRPATPPAGRPGLISSVFRRQIELEPTGRWLAGRSDVEWPDAVVGDRATRLMPRCLVAVTLVVCASTASAISGWPAFWILAALAVATEIWFEFWIRWDLQSVGRRVVVFVVQWIFAAGMVWINPLAAFYAFVGYLFAGTLFTGWLVVLGVLATAMVVAASQTGGRQVVLANFGIYLGLTLLNFVIALAFVTLSNRREDAIRKRHAANNELVAAQRANLALQQQLVDQARLSGVQDERARLARDLHDTVAQGLVAVVTQLESIDDRVLADDVRRRVESAKSLARQGLAEARRAVHALRPAELDDHTLPDALRAMVSDWSEHNRIGARLFTSGLPKPTAADSELIRVGQEALSNIARHAQARSVAVTLTYLDDQLLMDIRDDGTGFDPAMLAGPKADGGHGLIGMVERLRLAGGDLVVESEPGGGCVVSAVMPA